MAVDITHQPRRVQYVGGGTGPYPFAFELLDETDVAVYQDDTLLAITADYTVALNEDGTGSVTTADSMTGSNVTMVGAREYERITDYATGGDFDATTINDELDSFIILLQQLREVLARTLKLPTTTELDGDAAFPEPEANQLIGWNGTGTGLVNLSVLSEGDLLVSSFIETLLNDVDADEARGTLGAVGLTGNETITGNKTFSGQASGFGIPVVKRKTADESVTSSDVLQDDDHLTFAIAANEEWVASFEITCGDLLSTTGVKAAITTPAGATQRIFSMHETNAGDAVGSGSTTTSGAAIVSSTPAAGTQTFIRISLWVLNGATPGNVTLQWAQVNTSGTALTFKKGSHMIAHRIA